MLFRILAWGLCGFLLLIMTACNQSYLTPTPEATIAVWDLEDLSPQPTPLPVMGEALSAAIIKTLQEEGFRAVEREKLLALLEELHLGTTELANPETKLKLGRLAGARYMIFGAYQTVGDCTRFDLRLVEVETGRVLKTTKKVVKTQDPETWLTSLEELTRELVQK